MARGWESKSVEEQQAEAAPSRAFSIPPPTAEEAERAALLLQRKRIEVLIQGSSNPRYIQQQEKAMAFLDEKLRMLGDSPADVNAASAEPKS